MGGPIPVSKASYEPMVSLRLSEMLTKLYAKSDRGHLHDVTVEAVCFVSHVPHKSRYAYADGKPRGDAVLFEFPAAVEGLSCPECMAPALFDVLGYNGVHGTWRIAGGEEEWKEF